MASCESVTYPGVSPQVFESLKQELQSKGFNIPGEQGTINGSFGITIDYAWDQNNQTLFTQVIDKNFFVSCNQIYDQLSTAINKFTV
jgi:hypothetical protein